MDKVLKKYTKNKLIELIIEYETINADLKEKLIEKENELLDKEEEITGLTEKMNNISVNTDKTPKKHKYQDLIDYINDRINRVKNKERLILYKKEKERLMLLN